MRCPAHHRRGFSLIEVLGALALVAIVSTGAVAMIDAALEDTRAQHAGRHQSKMTEASERYMRENYAALLSATGAGPVAVPVSALANLLPDGFQPSNAYGQTPCLRVVQPAPGRLNALIVGEGGESIPTKRMAYVAVHAGPGGGQIAADNPNVALGAFGSWQVAVDSYGTAPCGAAAGGPASNRLASALFFDGPSSAGTDYLYRNEVPGHPELNALEVPLAMRGRAVVVENDTTHPLCNVADPLSPGRIAVGADGVLLTCQDGAWRRQGSAFWKDPVPDFAALPASGNNVGEVRMTQDTSRAYAWNGVAWQALAVDQNGNFSVPGTSASNYVQVRSTQTVGAACAADGLISKDANGLLITCHGGRWSSQAKQELAYTEEGWSVIMRSNYVSYPPDTPFHSGPWDYDAPNDVMRTSIERNVTPTKDGLIISNASADMSVGTTTSPGDMASLWLRLELVDRDTGAVIATNRAREPRMTYDRSQLAVTLSKAVPVNTNGYAVRMVVMWSRHLRSYDSNFYDRSNYVDTTGALVELTPLLVGWSIDLTY